MAWDKEAADNKTAEFAEQLKAILAKATADQKRTLGEVQKIWKEAYSTSGHKRLAREFIKADLS